MLNVMFENSKGQSRIIGTVENEESAFKAINDFLDDHNYKSYYQRTWNKDDKTTVVDVGSHTEFFYIQGGIVNDFSKRSKKAIWTE